MPRFPIAHHTSVYHANNHTFTVPTNIDVPRFPPGPSALAHLKREGYVVIENMNASEVAIARELHWSFLEGMQVTFRRDPETHRPRINKLDSVVDKEQKRDGNYFFMDEADG